MAQQRQPHSPSVESRPSRIVWLAAALGYFVDTFVSTLIGAVGSQFDPTLAQGISLRTTAAIITAILLVLSTGFGGWVAGRLARQEYLLHGVLVGGIGVVAMLIESMFGQPYPLTNILLQFVAVLVGGVGGWLSQRIPAARAQ